MLQDINNATTTTASVDESMILISQGVFESRGSYIAGLPYLFLCLRVC